MIINVYCPSNGKSFCLSIGVDLNVKDFKVLCSKEVGVSSSKIKLVFNGEPLIDDGKTLTSYKVDDNDMIILEVQSHSATPGNLPNIDFSAVPVPDQRSILQPSTGLGAASALLRNPPPSSLPQIDFSQIRVPGQSSSKPANSSSNNPLSRQLSDPIDFRKAMLENPQQLEMVRKIYPPVAEALLSGTEEHFIEEFFKFRDVLQRQQPLRSADPMDIEVQKKIADEIHRQNIEENMTMAMQENPESFAQVLMLWINLKVNGHHVKAFVDSGAQMTIMSAKCAERCNIMRLVDRRWEGVAKGVGTQKIIGRIHLAQIQIEDVFLQCSFCILEDQPMDVLLGLDMLRRHQCVIDLGQNALTIGTNNTKTRFLAESELPSYGRLHDPNAPPGALPSASKDGQASFCQRQHPPPQLLPLAVTSNTWNSRRAIGTKTTHSRTKQSQSPATSKKSDREKEEPVEKARKLNRD